MWAPPPIQELDSSSSSSDDGHDDQDDGQGQHNGQGQHRGHGQHDGQRHLQWLQEDDLGIDMANVDPFVDIDVKS